MSKKDSRLATKKHGDKDEFMMDARKIMAIDMLIDGENTRTDIAKKVGVSRQTLYSWLDNVEFKAELDARLANKKTFIQKLMDSKLDFALDKLLEIAEDDKDRRVQAQVLLSILDRTLGKAVSKHELVVDDTQTFDTDKQEIKEVFDTIDVDAIEEDVSNKNT